MVEFFPATKDDLAAIAEIYNHYILHSTATFHCKKMGPGDMSEVIYLSNPDYLSFVVKEKGGIIGYCFLAPYHRRQAYRRSVEASIYLRPEYTGKGIGCAALDRLEAAAKKAGIRVVIGTLCSENSASIRLLEKAGYSKCAHLKNVGEKFGKVLDVVMYQKEI